MSKVQKSQKKVFRDNIRGITSGALRRIMYRAAVPRRGIEVNEALRGVIYKRLEEIIPHALVFMEHDKRKTVMEKDIRAAASLEGRELIAVAKITTTHGKIPKTTTEGKKHKSKLGKVALRKIKWYQNIALSGCLLIPLLPFGRVVREIGQEYASHFSDLRYQGDALTVLQMWIETELVDLCYNAFLLAHHAGRDTLMVKDIDLIQHIRHK